MHIEKLEIRGFGKFNNLTLGFNKGLNIVFGRNESGKSTVQWFIRGMLYGLKGGRTSKDGLPPPLRKFRPWSAGDFGGSMEYLLDNGERYRVERNFSGNTVKVYDSLFNDITASFNINREKGIDFAERHLRLNESCFERTVFIRQMEARIDDDGGKELLNRLMNVSETGFEDLSFKRAQKALKDALKNHVGTEKTSTRPLDKVLDRLEELKSIKSRLIEKRNSMFSIENELGEAAASRDNIERHRQFLLLVKEVIDIKKEMLRQEECQDTLNELLTLKERDAKIEAEILSRKVESLKIESQLEPLKGFADMDENIEDSVLEIKKDIRNLKDEYEKNNVDALNAQIAKAKNKERIAIYAAAALLLSALLLTALGIFRNRAGFAASVPLFAAAAVFIISGKKASKRLMNLKNEKRMAFIISDGISEKIEAGRKKLGIIFEKVGTGSAEDFLVLKMDFNSKVQQLSNINTEIDKLEDELESNKRKICRIDDSLRQKQFAVETEDMYVVSEEKANLLRDSLDKALAKIPETCEDEAYFISGPVYSHKSLIDSKPEEIENLWRLDFDKCSGELNEILLKLKEYEVMLKSLPDDEDEMQEVDEELEVLELKKCRLEDTNISLKTALDILTEASLEIQKDFVPGLNTRMRDIIDGITGGRYKSLMADNTLALKTIAPESGEVVAAAALSGGTADQMYLALRIAMAETLSANEEKLPLIMDEVFAQYDDLRTREAMRFLYELSSDRQVILFTCKERETEIIREVCTGDLRLLEI